MAVQKPSLPKGTRDFGSERMGKRTYILDTIKEVFKKYGFQPLETPAIENLSVLTGKYGDEGDQLLFKILNSGEYLSKSNHADFQKGSKHLTSKICKKGLRYDLTVPFARYVAMNRTNITFPFKRYQIQPVWRADRPGRGRYQEFYQCDADMIGTQSLICEAEIVLMVQEVFSVLEVNCEIKINNRKILEAIAEAIGEKGKQADLCVAIDKLDKIGVERVNEELVNRGFSARSVNKLQPLLNISGYNLQKIQSLKEILANSKVGMKGVTEIEKVFEFVKKLGGIESNITFEITLARGLSYYTGAIFEVVANNVKIGSICGGGRYDDLTGNFGMPNTSGVGISFGIDRIFDVIEALNAFPKDNTISTQLLLVSFHEKSFSYCLPLVKKLRDKNIRTEIYPENTTLKKQMTYANNKKIPFVILVGDNEMESGQLTFKNMKTGTQELLSIEQIIEKLIITN